MLALTSTGTPDLLHLAEVDEPSPGPTEVVVRLVATSLNRGEVAHLGSAVPGQRPGWDVAGVVERPAAAGGGPQPGDRVVGLVPGGGWAERVAVSVDRLAVIPDGVSEAQAACLPVAGLTALRALALGGFSLGRSLLVTGASGGVGHLAAQLARGAGMTVTGLIRRPDASPAAAAACDQVVTDLAGSDGPYDHILEGVGGRVLARCLEVVAPGGMVVSYASTLMEPAPLGPRWFGAHLGASLRSLLIFDELRRTDSAPADLGTLCALIAAGRLVPQIAVEADWSRAGELAHALLAREVTGKVVLSAGA